MFSTVESPTLTNMQIEDRKIYNTRMYSQSNTGHEFTDVLTDAERTAILEYLKTL
jgi:mono/diheme cytochrome c family protein